ncbi:STAS domain-containing protein [Mangrovihabitans endophyticus]|nr:STAS domain-containing protein [Mangrovihabitans endophyticus]
MAEPDHCITSHHEGDVVRLRLGGELDITVRDDLRDIVLAAVAEAGAGGVIIDFSDTAFIESEAIGALLDGMNAAKAEKVPFRAVNPQGLVLRVLTVSGVLELFDD